MESGDILNAMSFLTVYCLTYYYSGLPLAFLLEDIERFCYQMLDYQQNLSFLANLPLWQCLLNLSGRSKDPLNMEAGDAIEKHALAGPNAAGIGKETIKSYWMQLSFYFGDIEKATGLYEQLEGIKMSYGMLATVIYHGRVFFFALVCIANLRKGGTRKYKVNAKKYIAFFKELVHSGSINLVHKLQILEADFMALGRAADEQDLLRNYDVALVSASKTGFLQDAAVCAILAAEYCNNSRDLRDSAEMYVVRAHELYMTWGATSVADSIKTRYPSAFADKDISNVVASSGVRGRARFRPSIAEAHKTVTRDDYHD
jgi:hypothetical protein